MKALRIATAVLVVVALSSSCGSSARSTGSTTISPPPSSGRVSTPSNSAPASPAATIVPPPATSTREAPKAIVNNDGALKHGAAAAPLNVGGKAYTREMYDNFAVTVVYEATKNSDMDLLEILDSASAPLAYQYGRDVCDAVEQTQLTLRTIVDNLHGNIGLSIGGAQAAVAGAAGHLCGNAEIEGYKTYFDTQVINSQAQIRKVTRALVREDMFGWATRVTCDYLSFYGRSAGLRQALESFHPYGTETIDFPFPARDGGGYYTTQFDVVITTVASFWCSIDSDLLGATYYHS